MTKKKRRVIIRVIVSSRSERDGVWERRGQFCVLRVLLSEKVAEG